MGKRILAALGVCAALFITTQALAGFGASSKKPVNPKAIGQGFGGHYEATGGVVLIDSNYFQTVNALTHYVDPSTGNDTVNTGASTSAAWATVQRCLDDVPDGAVASIFCHVVGGTFSGAQTWILHAELGGTNTVKIEGDCSSPQATYTTTGAGTAVVANSVTKLAQFSFTPTVATGSHPSSISDGQYWFMSQASGAQALVRGVMTSTSTAMTLNITSGTAISTNTPRLCSWSTVFSGTISIGSVNRLATTKAPALLVYGIKFSSLSAVNNATLGGVHVTSPSNVLTLRDVTLTSGNYITASVLAQNFWGFDSMSSGSIFAAASSTIPQLTVVGRIVSVGGVVLKGINGNYIITIGSNTTGTVAPWGYGEIAQFAANDLEGTCNVVGGDAAIYLTNGRIASGSSTAMMSMDIVGSPFYLERGSMFRGQSTVSGKYTVASSVRSGSQFLLNSATWSATNTSTSTSNWIVGTRGTHATSELPLNDPYEGVLVSATLAGGNTPQSTTCADSGDGSAAACTLTPLNDVVLYTCSDSDGCTVTISEASAVSGWTFTVINVSANTVTFADTSGVSELGSGFAAAQWDSLTLTYASDRWAEAARNTTNTRTVQLPIPAWVPCTGQGIWTTDNAVGTEPNLTALNTGLTIKYDVDALHIDTDKICTTFSVPDDYVSGGAFKARVIGGTTTNVETWSCALSKNGGALGSTNAANLASSASAQSVTSTPTGSYVIGDSVAVVCSQGNANADDAVSILSVRWFYVASH